MSLSLGDGSSDDVVGVEVGTSEWPRSWPPPFDFQFPPTDRNWPLRLLGLSG